MEQNLESVGFTGPSQVMLGKHDEIRTLFRKIEEDYHKGDLVQLKNMVFLEERILFPSSLRKLPPQVWSAIRKGESSIGYCWIKPGNLWDPNITGVSETDTETVERGKVSPSGSDKIPLDTGNLTQVQINLLLKNLPLDMTYVDENDKVVYRSRFIWNNRRIFLKMR